MDDEFWKMNFAQKNMFWKILLQNYVSVLFS